MSGRYTPASGQERPVKPRTSNVSATASAVQREQELCLKALDSGDYDSMTDRQWVELCERTAREDKETSRVMPGDEAPPTRETLNVQT